MKQMLGFVWDVKWQLLSFFFFFSFFFLRKCQALCEIPLLLFWFPINLCCKSLSAKFGLGFTIMNSAPPPPPFLHPCSLSCVSVWQSHDAAAWLPVLTCHDSYNPLLPVWTFCIFPFLFLVSMSFVCVCVRVCVCVWFVCSCFFFKGGRGLLYKWYRDCRICSTFVYFVTCATVAFGFIYEYYLYLNRCF